MFTPRQIFTGGTKFQKNGSNIMFAPREIFTEGTNFERYKKNLVSYPHEIFMWGTNVKNIIFWGETGTTNLQGVVTNFNTNKNNHPFSFLKW